MTARVQQVNGELHIVVTPEMAASLGLGAGAEVDVRALPATQEHTYASDDEVMEAFRAVEPQFRESFRELAK